MDSRPTTPHARTNNREYVGRLKRVKGDNFEVSKHRLRQRVERFINELEQGTSSLTDEEFARLERMIKERRGRAAAHVAVTPIDTAQPCNPQPRSSEISFGLHVCIEENT